MKRVIIWGLIATLSGCASHGVRCGGALRPINPPNVPLAVTHADTPTPTLTPTSGADAP